MLKRRAAGSLTARDLRPIVRALGRTNQRLAREYPGDPLDRQPVHTVYGGAHLYRAGLAAKLGAAALAALDEYAPDAESFSAAFDLHSGDGDRAGFAATVRERVVRKLLTEPVEDFRIDFEDGYGVRSDAEEDGHAIAAASELAVDLSAGTVPPFVGIRIKPMSREANGRALRTLDLFVSTLAKETRRQLPANFLVTVPKLLSPGQVAAAAATCTTLERRLKLRPRAISLEIMIETPQAIVGADGSIALRALVAAGDGRVAAAHFGAYDYTALCGITASEQRMRHPACDAARHLMQVALAQTPLRLSDGATVILPIPPHRPASTDDERRENRATVHRAWQAHAADVRHSLASGFYQGWDLHPAQLPSRYAAVYEFFAKGRPAAIVRLRNFVDQAARATLVGELFDDAATGQGLLNFFLRGVSSGALTLDEVRETGLTPDELQGRSFAQILAGRRRT